MKKVTLCIQNGHRNTTTGATGTSDKILVDAGVISGPVTYEVDLIDKVFYALRDKLISAGIELYYDDANLENTKRLGEALNYFIALHFDGSVNRDYNGGFIDDAPQCPNGGIMPCDMDASGSWKFAQVVADHYFSSMGIAYADSHRTKNSTYYYAFNETGEKTKQFIIELGTLTNASDRAKLFNVGKIAELLFNGIIAYLSQYDKTYQEYVSANQPKPPTVDPVTACKQEYEQKIVKLQQEFDKKLSDELKKCQDKYTGLIKDERKKVITEIIQIIEKLA